MRLLFPNMVLVRPSMAHGSVNCSVRRGFGLGRTDGRTVGQRTRGSRITSHDHSTVHRFTAVLVEFELTVGRGSRYPREDRMLHHYYYLPGVLDWCLVPGSLVLYSTDATDTT